MAVGTFLVGLAGLGLGIYGAVTEGQATEAQIGESIADYQEAITNTEAQLAEIESERTRQLGTIKGAGVLELKEQGAQSAYESRIAMTQAEMTASAVENKLGASGVRQTGSPLLAAQQQVDLAYAQADRTVESGRAAMTLGGAKLAGAMGDISAAATLATAEYQRRLATYRRKLTAIGGVPTTGTANTTSLGSGFSSSPGFR